ncbi:hypothetical protein AC578_5275 [Pseudocercospora eumusae]|uniref:Carbohydrate kinase PfkB domain-containing protein n=1 Tax=Pseudocercospora eumusae TaxID=321146 RepID=A0A139GYP4_9PEZI|nr:hypothetical protein AC578_5275 [Pseudocercospora eumusae]
MDIKDVCNAEPNAENGQHVQIDFCTLGMFIIDDIYPPPNAKDQTPQKNVIGGAGTFSAIGARLFSPPPQSKSVGWIVDAGTDFPPELRAVIESWETSVLFRDRPAPTTRGWNGYSGNEHRDFKYLTEKKRLTSDDLTPTLLASKSFHLICSPIRCIEQVQGILSERKALFGAHHPRPIIIWEPVPDLCTPAELQNTFQALKYVDVISPNHDELASMFAFTHNAKVVKTAIENHAQRFLEHGIGPENAGAVVVRTGAAGCFVLSKASRKWLPAYHSHASKVVDPTGGGNGFLGGLAVGLVRTNMDFVEAARWGSVAASFCIEQTGMPKLGGPLASGELWNGTQVFERLAEYKQRSV